MSADLFNLLHPLERRLLENKGYQLSKNVFQEDICSRQPGIKNDFNDAVTVVAKLLGYRDAYCREFQKTRKVYTKLTEGLKYFI